ncbi:hypothetical protein TKK_0015917 [Trichogramma kaykai]|uniref:F-box domain-containing protein n=1 Tax=Trichogramma kaykai TaxID=54128 RepID=A0ABD2W8F7_9HYME
MENFILSDDILDLQNFSPTELYSLCDFFIDEFIKDQEFADSFYVSELHLATVRLNYVEFKKVIDKCKDVNVKEPLLQRTALHLACLLPNLRCELDQLIRSMQEGNNRLRYFLRQENKDLRFVELLLQHKCDINAKDMYDRTPLYYLCDGVNYHDLRQQLRGFGDNFMNAVMRKVSKRRLAIMNLLLDNYADIETKDINGCSLMHLVTCFDDDIQAKETADLLIKHYINVNATIQKGSAVTPLLMAIYRQRIPLIHLLIRYCANLTITDAENHNCLHAAAYNLDKHTIIALLKAGACACDVSVFGETPLHMMIRKENHLQNISEIYKEIVKQLTSYGCDINYKNVEGETVLFVAASRKDYDLVQICLNNGADINITNNLGETVLLHCISNNISQSCALLMKHMKKLEIYGLHLNNENHLLLNTFESQYATYNNTFINECKKEIEKLKNINIVKSLTLYTILSMSLHEIQKLKDYSLVMKNLQMRSNYCRKNFLEYYFLYEIFITRLKLWEKWCDEAFTSLNFIIGLQIPHKCMLNIFKYLEYRELCLIVQARKLIL